MTVPADRFAVNVLPKAGAATLRDLAAALNAEVSQRRMELALVVILQRHKPNDSVEVSAGLHGEHDFASLFDRSIKQDYERIAFLSSHR